MIGIKRPQVGTVVRRKSSTMKIIMTFILVIILLLGAQIIVKAGLFIQAETRIPGQLTTCGQEPGCSSRSIEPTYCYIDKKQEIIPFCK